MPKADHIAPNAMALHPAARTAPGEKAPAEAMAEAGPEAAADRGAGKPCTRVEIFGPIGCGKTTLCEAIGRNAGAGSVRVFKTERPRLAIRSIAARCGRWLVPVEAVADVLPRRLLAPLLRDYRHPIELETLAADNSLIERFVCDVLFERPRVACDPALSLKRMHKFMRDLSDLCLLADCGDAGTYVFDETLVMRGIGFSFGAADPEAVIGRYLHHLPLPSAAIYLTADMDRVTRQIEQRDGTDALKLKRCAESIDLAEIMYRKIAGKIPILRLRNEREGDLVENCRAALAFVRDLGADKERGYAHA